MQIKQAMVQGKQTLNLFYIKKQDWKKAKNITNFWKPIPQNDIKYYNAKTNIIITNDWLRSVIDFLDDIES